MNISLNVVTFHLLTYVNCLTLFLIQVVFQMCGRWHKPVAVPFNERKCRTCLNCLEDEFHFLLECPLYHELRKKYIKPYYLKILNMPKFIELIKTENKIRNLSMFIMKSFEIRKKNLF